MSILVDVGTRVVVQGITGREGSVHAKSMLEYGTRVVAGVTPGKGGTTHLGFPVHDTVAEAVRQEGADTAAIFVPALAAADAIMEAADAGIGLIVCVTEGIPILDTIRVKAYLRGRATRLIGPNSPGLISPGQSNVGLIPGSIHRPGPIGLISRAGTLAYEAVQQLTTLGLGQSTVVGIGADPVVGLSFADVLTLFSDDPNTAAVVLIGEIGGRAEEDAAALVSQGYPKPVIAFIAGQAAPSGRRLGHAGAIVSGRHGTAQEKIGALWEAGVLIAPSPAEIGATVKGALLKGY